MPCSCKAKRNRAVTPKPEAPKEIKNTKQSIIQIVSDSTTYDYSSTTRATELCYNCIRKHLGAAYTMLQTQDPQEFLTGLGEVLCASLHLVASNQNLYKDMRTEVLGALRSKNKQHLMEKIYQWVQTVQTFDTPVAPPKLTPVQAYLCSLMTAYGLLFVQVSYENLNKTWATGELVRGAVKKFRQDKNIQEYQQARKIWKLVQDMQPYDKTYNAAQRALREELRLQTQKYWTGQANNASQER